jgi:hypothetical protein
MSRRLNLLAPEIGSDLVRIEATDVENVGPSGSLFELLLPAGMRVLSGELADVDAVLDDARFFGPFLAFFDPLEGRPSIPIETFLRMLFLKYRFKLGYVRLGARRSASWGPRPAPYRNRRKLRLTFPTRHSHCVDQHLPRRIRRERCRSAPCEWCGRQPRR